MFLKSIYINGFKSFPDKYEIRMTSRVTGIVGPNGSGKSNIGDAIRWVLGEQSAKSMRGDKMEDVIFNGTQLRKQKAFCEVSLLFENVSGRVLPDCTEIEVSRKLYRSGDSEYIINGRVCRLKDVLELFRDTGIGREGYSIIGQGKIDEVLNEKSISRRKVFEEASGIMKYRARKEEAERKLEHTGANLTRVADILEEIGSRVEPLRISCENTRRYNTLIDRLKRLEVNIFLYNCEKNRERAKKLLNEIEQTEGLIEAKKDELKNIDAAHFENRALLEKLEARLDEQNGRAAAVKGQSESLKGELKLYGEKLINAGERLTRAAKEKEEAISAAAALEENIARLRSEEEGLKSYIAQKEGEKGELERKIDEAAGMMDDDEIEVARQALFELLNELSNVNSSIAGISSTLESLELKRGEIQAGLNELGGAEDGDGELEALARENEKRTSEALARANELMEAARKSEAQWKEAKASGDEGRRRLNELIARKNMLSELARNYEGYYDGVKNLLKLKASDPAVRKKALSTVAEAISAPEKYDAALESALSGSLQNIIVETDYDARDLIEVLRAKNLGRATFLPLSSLKIRPLTALERRCLETPGVLGVASELVSYEARYKNAIDFLLSRTVIAKDMDTAIAVMRAHGYAFRTVTLKGDVLNPSGAITGGSRKSGKTGLLSRERELAAAQNEIDALRGGMEKADASLARLEQNTRAAYDLREKALKEAHTLEIEGASLREKLLSAKEAKRRAQERYESLKAALEENERALSHAGINLDKLTVKRDAIDGMQLEKNLHLKRLEAKYDGVAGRADKLKEELAAINVELTAKRKDVESRAEAIKRQTDERAALLEAAGQKEAEIERLEADEVSLKQKRGAIEAQISGLDDEYAKCVGELKDISDKRGALKAEIEDKSRFTSRVAGELAALNEKKIRAEMSVERAQSEYTEAQNRLWDDYAITYAMALNMRMPLEGVGAAREETLRIKEEIREMGPINPNAVEEYAELTGRFDSLSEQKEDLERARDDLLSVIAELKKKMEKTFLERFSVIRAYFKEAFAELFGGGRADLALTEHGNVMESGIEITAEPPGKKLQSISLLSGGEKAMTAISLLFAMQKINPSPVCVLDEIDAALDDANLAKYLEYIKRYSSSVQFIMITHRKGAMSICDALYGVAMEEKGVSKILSVRLNEAAS